MRKKILHLFTVFALSLCLPLSGISAMRIICHCSGEATNGQQAVNTKKIDQHSGCAEENQAPQPYSPCPCEGSSCGDILETKKITPTLFLTEATAFAEAMDLKTERGAFFNPDEAFLFTPDPLPHQVLYLQIHTLRC